MDIFVNAHDKVYIYTRYKDLEFKKLSHEQNIKIHIKAHCS